MLTINRNRLEEKGALALAKVIEKMKSLEYLEFYQNGISTKGMKSLFLALKENKNLEVLKINDNFTKSALQDLIDIIPGFTELKIIDISDSITEENLGNKLGVELFKALSSIESLEEIYCNYNEIINKSDSITEEDLGNKLGVELFKALSSIESLEEIYCNYNEIINKNSQKEIFEYLKKFKNLKIVQLKGNEINKKNL